jgi:branched-chain amino acid transport system ATP-binding protein
MSAMLDVQALECKYGRVPALKGVDLRVDEREVVALIGANGAGKTTLLRTLSGVHPVSAGRVEFAGHDITRLSPHRRVSLGVSQVPEGRQVFTSLTVLDNLLLGSIKRNAQARSETCEKVLELFPALRSKLDALAGTLSGGQQQMLAFGRALMAAPQMLLLDEPSMGLAPLIIEEVYAVIRQLKAAGVTVLLVEQNARLALEISDRAYVLENGRIVASGPSEALRDDEVVRKAYLGH